MKKVMQVQKNINTLFSLTHEVIGNPGMRNTKDYKIVLIHTIKIFLCNELFHKRETLVIKAIK